MSPGAKNCVHTRKRVDMWTRRPKKRQKVYFMERESIFGPGGHKLRHRDYPRSYREEQGFRSTSDEEARAMPDPPGRAKRSAAGDRFSTSSSKLSLMDRYPLDFAVEAARFAADLLGGVGKGTHRGCIARMH